MQLHQCNTSQNPIPLTKARPHLEQIGNQEASKLNKEQYVGPCRESNPLFLLRRHKGHQTTVRKQGRHRATSYVARQRYIIHAASLTSKVPLRSFLTCRCPLQSFPYQILYQKSPDCTATRLGDFASKHIHF